MPLYLTTQTEQLIRHHAETAYPNECCGFLLGKYNPGGVKKDVREIFQMTNQRADSPQNRFLISPEETLRAEKEAVRRGLEIVGYYHSHPDHPARPSEYDFHHTPWPGYSSIIVQSFQKGTGELTSWILREDRSTMDQEDLIIK
ncbi:MAG: hypothetical protein A3G87_00890 [Omnitrophica bacterium RIFCSPLOWO2_12_FULL_50_11]|nr:MAG: hypothetical protein A3G87_00890 [Omnitrophica bacterium RIFCSPLOWO2_12_FULL_50_11]